MPDKIMALINGIDIKFRAGTVAAIVYLRQGSMP